MQGLSGTGGGGLRVSKMGKLQDKGKLGMFKVVMCMLVIVAPSIVVGVWSLVNCISATTAC